MNPRLRLLLALLLPFFAAGVQWLLWEQYIKPYVWFLFFPAAFFSAWLGGFRGGLAGAVIGALLVWYVYIPPQFSFSLKGWAVGASIVLFVAMGGLYAWFFERLGMAQRSSREAIAAAAVANAEIGRLISEEQLRASETRFEATFEQAAVGIALVGPDGRWMRVNRKLCEIVGYAPDELMSKTFQDITHPADLDTDLGLVRRMLAKEIDTYAMEKRYFHKQGGIIWINLTVALVWRPDGTPDYFISVVEDISARKAAETELKQRNAELERFDKASVGREMEMIRLKRQVNELAAALGRPLPFDLSFADEGGAGKAAQA